MMKLDIMGQRSEMNLRAKKSPAVLHNDERKSKAERRKKHETDASLFSLSIINVDERMACSRKQLEFFFCDLITDFIVADILRVSIDHISFTFGSKILDCETDFFFKFTAG